MSTAEKSPRSITGAARGLSNYSFGDNKLVHHDGNHHEHKRCKKLGSQIPSAAAASRAPKGIGNYKQAATEPPSSKATHVAPSLRAPGISTTSKENSKVCVTPRKGTYQEILARAKAAQESQSSSGIIKHKPVTKTSRRERLKRFSQSSPESHVPDKMTDAVNSRRDTLKSLQPDNLVETSAKKRKRVELGYKGTMRPSSESAAHLRFSRFSNDTATKDSKGIAADTLGSGGNLKYRITTERGVGNTFEEYGSDASSDMEAAAFDLEEEEQQSLSAAKREDEAAAAEELELRRKKAERRKKFTQMAAIAAEKRKL